MRLICLHHQINNYKFLLCVVQNSHITPGQGNQLQWETTIWGAPTSILLELRSSSRRESSAFPHSFWELLMRRTSREMEEDLVGILNLDSHICLFFFSFSEERYCSMFAGLVGIIQRKRWCWWRKGKLQSKSLTR